MYLLCFSVCQCAYTINKRIAHVFTLFYQFISFHYKRSCDVHDLGESYRWVWLKGFIGSRLGCDLYEDAARVYTVV